MSTVKFNLYVSVVTGPLVYRSTPNNLIIGLRERYLIKIKGKVKSVIGLCPPNKYCNCHSMSRPNQVLSSTLLRRIIQCYSKCTLQHDFKSRC